MGGHHLGAAGSQELTPQLLDLRRQVLLCLAPDPAKSFGFDYGKRCGVWKMSSSLALLQTFTSLCIYIYIYYMYMYNIYIYSDVNVYHKFIVIDSDL